MTNLFKRLELFPERNSIQGHSDQRCFPGRRWHPQICKVTHYSKTVAESLSENMDCLKQRLPFKMGAVRVQQEIRVWGVACLKAVPEHSWPLEIKFKATTVTGKVQNWKTVLKFRLHLPIQWVIFLPQIISADWLDSLIHSLSRSRTVPSLWKWI